jgi:hypothetical protein
MMTLLFFGANAIRNHGTLSQIKVNSPSSFHHTAFFLHQSPSVATVFSAPYRWPLVSESARAMLDMVGIAVMVVVMGIDTISLQKGKVRESLAFFVEQFPLEKDNISCASSCRSLLS